MAHLINKKGVFLTLGVIFISLTILTLANVIINNSETSENRIKEFAETERLYNLDRSISSSLERVMNDALHETHNISAEGNVITFTTRFSDRTRTEERDMMQQLAIFNDRLEDYSGVEFTNRYPLLGLNYLFFGGTGTPTEPVRTNSTRFFLRNTPELFIEYASYPYNMIYLNGFNETNTIAINITYDSPTMEPMGVTPGFDAPSTILGACSSCFSLFVNTYDTGSLVDAVSYNLSQLDDVSFDLTTQRMLFILNVTSPNFGSTFQHNRTLALNWINLSFFSINSFSSEKDTTQGLAIILPDLLQTNIPMDVFDFSYYDNTLDLLGGYPDPYGLDGDATITVQIFMKGEPADHQLSFMSPGSYSLALPLLETSGTLLRTYQDEFILT